MRLVQASVTHSSTAQVATGSTLLTKHARLAVPIVKNVQMRVQENVTEYIVGQVTLSTRH
jgi:hypothetical protein